MFSSILNPSYKVDLNHLKTILNIIALCSELPEDSWDFTTTRAKWGRKNKQDSTIHPSSEYHLKDLSSSGFKLSTSDKIFLLLNEMERNQTKGRENLNLGPKKIIANFSKNSDNISFYLRDRYSDTELRSLIYVHSFDSISLEQKNILKEFPDNAQIGQSAHEQLNLISMVGHIKFEKFLFYTKTFENSKILYVKNLDEKAKNQSFHILCSIKI